MTSKRTDLVFDVYISSSTKDIERKGRETLKGKTFEGNINELLSNSRFNDDLLNFF